MCAGRLEFTGGMAEWFKATVLKTVVPLWYRGFESLSLRHFRQAKMAENRKSRVENR